MSMESEPGNKRFDQRTIRVQSRHVDQPGFIKEFKRIGYVSIISVWERFPYFTHRDRL